MLCNLVVIGRLHITLAGLWQCKRGVQAWLVGNADEGRSPLCRLRIALLLIQLTSPAHEPIGACGAELVATHRAMLTAAARRGGGPAQGPHPHAE
jgi:hypothetical protein